MVNWNCSQLCGLGCPDWLSSCVTRPFSGRGTVSVHYLVCYFSISVNEDQTDDHCRPGPEAAILLSAYDFANANKLFCFNLINLPAASKTDITPFSAFLSLTSYLFQHAHRSARTALYSHVNLYILQIVIEDPALAKRICSEESKTPVRLCRQRQPYLPVVRTERVLAAYILDIMIDGINHNLRRRLDTEYYMYDLNSICRGTGADLLSLCLGVILRIISFLARSRIRFGKRYTSLHRLGPCTHHKKSTTGPSCGDRFSRSSGS